MVRKLVSRKGTLLGTVTFPSHWGELIERQGGVRFALRKPLRISDMLAEASVETLMQTGALYQAHDYNHRDALILDGVMLEEFEAMPDCSFSPSAAYLRSITQ
jgi:hypothetical protein